MIRLFSCRRAIDRSKSNLTMHTWTPEASVSVVTILTASSCSPWAPPPPWPCLWPCFGLALLALALARVHAHAVLPLLPFCLSSVSAGGQGWPLALGSWPLPLPLPSPQAMGGLPPKHAVQTFLGGLDCDFTGCGSGCPPGNSDLRLTS